MVLSALFVIPSKITRNSIVTSIDNNKMDIRFCFIDSKPLSSLITYQL